MAAKQDPDFEIPFKSKREFKGFDLEKQIENLKKAGKPYFSFLDKDHVYQLCLNYYEIKD